MGVPRVWEKIMEKIKEGISRCGYMKRKLVTWAMSVSLEANQRLTKYVNCFTIYHCPHYIEVIYKFSDVFMIIFFKLGMRRSHSSSLLQTVWSCRSFVLSWASLIVWSSSREQHLLEVKHFSSSLASTFGWMKSTGWVKARDPTLCLDRKCTDCQGKPSYLNLKVEYLQSEGQ